MLLHSHTKCTIVQEEGSTYMQSLKLNGVDWTCSAENKHASRSRQVLIEMSIIEPFVLLCCILLQVS